MLSSLIHVQGGLPTVPLQLMMPAETAHDTVAALGEVGLLQFKDLNGDKSSFQRTFANQVYCLPADSQSSGLCSRSSVFTVREVTVN